MFVDIMWLNMKNNLGSNDPLFGEIVNGICAYIWINFSDDEPDFVFQFNSCIPLVNIVLRFKIFP